MTCVIGTNSSKGKRLNGEESQYFSDVISARHKNDHQVPTNSTNISDKTRTKYIENVACKKFCIGTFTVISRLWMKDRHNYIAVGEGNPNP